VDNIEYKKMKNIFIKCSRQLGINGHRDVTIEDLFHECLLYYFKEKVDKKKLYIFFKRRIIDILRRETHFNKVKKEKRVTIIRDNNIIIPYYEDYHKNEHCYWFNRWIEEERELIKKHSGISIYDNSDVTMLIDEIYEYIYKGFVVRNYKADVQLYNKRRQWLNKIRNYLIYKLNMVGIKSTNDLALFDCDMFIKN